MPTPANVRTDQALTDFSLAVGLQMESQFVARRAFPVTPVPRQADKYRVYNSADLLRSDAAPFSGSGETAGRTYTLSEDSFFCEVFGLHEDISLHERENADPVLDPEEDAVRVLVQDQMINEDVKFAATAMVTTAWDNSETGGTGFTQWDDAASTPIEDIEGGRTTILQNTGKAANRLVVGHQTFASGLKNHPDLLDRVKYTQRGVLTSDLIAGLMDVDDFIVASGVYNSAQEGLSASNSFIVGDDALLLYTEAGGPRTPTAGKTFVWTAYGPQGMLTDRYEIDHLHAFPRVEVFRAFDHKVTSSALGYFFDDTIA